MVAAGLTPKAVYDGADTDLDVYLCNLCEFAFAMQDCIKRINKHSFNNFQLRIGESRVLYFRCCLNLDIEYLPIFVNFALGPCRLNCALLFHI